MYKKLLIRSGMFIEKPKPYPKSLKEMCLYQLLEIGHEDDPGANCLKNTENGTRFETMYQPISLMH